MPNYSHSTIIGHAGRDAEARYMPNGDAVTSFPVAVTRKRKDKETTTWWQISVFGKQAEWAAEIQKGNVVFASGEPVMEEWTDKDGNKRQTLKLLAHDVVNHGKWQKVQEKENVPHDKQSGGELNMPDDDLPF